ncbi:transglutaminase-like domain-containing protein [Marilutibacter chinensis]|uniref:Transglutaminase-like domain-containing protein n=1 Tax=Marilutibacter chinensis TaxID=2912247 RepID=A0ABS9HW54_9GAMM|nr:transglutaminase-like domain-containing protein [Lysobacter chinensis]MCF7223134.1 transglutaminase-like domain-containing protein [Lysobacter chinensis]
MSSMVLPASAMADDTVREVVALVDGGRFAEAEARIVALLADDDRPAAQRQALAFERERMRRIRLDFPHDVTSVRAKLQEEIPDLQAGEFAAWDTAGALEHLVIDGERRYFARTVPNLFRVNAEAAARRATPRNGVFGPMETLNPHHAEVRDAALATGQVHVAPRRIRVSQSLIVDADAVPAGETVKAWIPYPRAIPGQQEDIRLLRTTPATHVLAPESARQRTVHMTRPAVAGEPTEFSVEYELTVRGQYHAIDPERVVPVVADTLVPFLAERPPHIVFTDDLRRFSQQVVGDETHPYRIARRLFAAVDRIPWASAREYSTISNISDYALRAGHADCGQQTLLLMALLRLNGIPTRWQSGMVYSDGDYDNLHDWGWMYLAPYGWVPMDVTTGLLDSDDEELRWFYFGGLDAYRIAFNDDYSQPLFPRKRHFRSETVDSQRGEVEWQGGNLYFDQWDYRFSAEVLDGGRTVDDQVGNDQATR